MDGRRSPFAPQPDEPYRTFLIFDPMIPTKEGEDELKMLYDSSNQSRYSVVANLGLFQTLIGFFSRFSQPVKFVQMHKTRTFLYCPEASFWFSLTIANEIPCLNDLGMQLVKFLADSFIMLHGPLKALFEPGRDLFVFKVRRHFDAVFKSLPLELLSTPGMLDGIQYARLQPKLYLPLTDFVMSLMVRFPCLKNFAMFHNVQLIHSDLDLNTLNTFFTLFRVLRDNTLDFTTKFEAISKANDERSIIFGIPKERARSKTIVSIDDDAFQCPIFLNGVEFRWVIFEYHLFFFNFFVDISNKALVCDFINHFRTELDLKDAIFTETPGGDKLNPKKDAPKVVASFYQNAVSKIKLGVLTCAEKPDVLLLMQIARSSIDFTREMYLKTDTGRWLIYVDIDQKQLWTVLQLNTSSTIANAYQEVHQFIGASFRTILY